MPCRSTSTVGESNGSSDNIIRITDGTGTNWGNMNMATLPDTSWELGHTYNVYMSFTLLETGDGQDVTGMLSIYDETDSIYLVENQVIAGVGGAGGTFDQVSLVQIKCGGTTNGGWISSDYMLGSIPEPESMSMLLGGLCLLLIGVRRVYRA